MLTIENLYSTYEYFYQQFYKEEDYILSKTPKTVQLCTNFFSFLQKKPSFHSFGVDFLSRYLSFQYNYWKGLDIKSFDGKLNFSFVYGPKAYERFKSRNIDFDYQLGLGSFSATHINVLLIKLKKEQTNYQNPIKMMFHNTDRGFSTCLEQTTLYNHKEKSCSTCNFADDCKEILKKKYVNIYKERGYKL